MLDVIKNNKKVVYVIAGVFILLFIIPFIEIIYHIVFTFGQIVGTNIRFEEQGICYK